MPENLFEAQYDISKKSKLKRFYDTNKVLIISSRNGDHRHPEIFTGSRLLIRRESVMILKRIQLLEDSSSTRFAGKRNSFRNRSDKLFPK